MATNPLRPSPQQIRALSALPPLSDFFDVPKQVNVSNAFSVELLIRYIRDPAAPVGNSLAMKINVFNDRGDKKSYTRSIEDGTLTPDATLQGFDSTVAASVKLFTFPGLPGGAEGLVTYIVRVGSATTMEFTFAEHNQGVTPSQLEVNALFLIQTGSA